MSTIVQALTLPSGDTVGLINEKEAAAYLGLAAQTLRNWRSAGVGPPFVKIGKRVGYRLSDLGRWVEDHLEDGK